MKTIADLTDAQLIEIAELALDYPNEGEWSIIRSLPKKETHISYSFHDGDGVTCVIPDNLNIYTYFDWGFYNQHKIFQLLNQWEIQPS